MTLLQIANRGQEIQSSNFWDTEAASIKRTITLPPDQDAWLREHPEVNFSGQAKIWLANFIAAYEGRGK